MRKKMNNNEHIYSAIKIQYNSIFPKWLLKPIIPSLFILLLGICFTITPYTAYAKNINVYSGQSIQSVIDDPNTVGGDVIIVHEGTYTENINFQGKAITIRSTDPNNAAVVAATIIDGNQTARVVSFYDEEGNETVLSGVTVRNGLADNGGGILCYYSSPTITKCNINNNSASADGGGMNCDHSSPNITNCKITQNYASNDGGGIKCYHSSPIIIGCIISDNSAS